MGSSKKSKRRARPRPEGAASRTKASPRDEEPRQDEPREGSSADEEVQEPRTGRLVVVALLLVILLAALIVWRAGHKEQPAPKADAPATEIPPTAVAEAEPNDTLATCQQLPRHHDLVVKGQLQAGNEDWFCPASPNFASSLKVTLTGSPDCPVTLEVHDVQGTRVASAPAAAPGTPLTIGNTGAVPRARAVSVKPQADCQAPSSQPYELTLGVVKKVDADFENEPNGEPKQATTVRAGRTMIGFATKADDVDYYVVPIRPAPADARFKLEVIPPPAVTLQAEVLGADKSVIYKATGTVGQPLTLRGIGLRSWEGHYYLKVTPLKGAGPGRAYSLRVELEPVGGPFEFEPNDVPRSGTPLPVVDGEGLVVSGYFSSAGDLDCYGMSINREATTYVSVEQIPKNLTVEATITGPEGTKPVTCTGGATCQGRPGKPGRIDLTVSSPTRGGYTLCLKAGADEFNHEQPYRVRARYEPHQAAPQEAGKAPAARPGAPGGKAAKPGATPLPRKASGPARPPRAPTGRGPRAGAPPSPPRPPATKKGAD